MTARRHHYVPESYLNAFADDSAQPYPSGEGCLYA
jgi:hypothetical protein